MKRGRLGDHAEGEEEGGQRREREMRFLAEVVSLRLRAGRVNERSVGGVKKRTSLVCRLAGL